MKLNLSGINLDQFLKNNPQFHKKTETIILTDGKNEFEVSFSQTQQENIHIPPTKIVEKTHQAKVNEALKLYGLWLECKKGGKQILPENYSKDLFKGMDLRIANLRGANLYEANLWGTNLSNSNLSNANLICTNLTNCIINKYTKGISDELIKNLK